MNFLFKINNNLLPQIIKIILKKIFNKNKINIQFQLNKLTKKKIIKGFNIDLKK